MGLSWRFLTKILHPLCSVDNISIRLVVGSHGYVSNSSLVHVVAKEVDSRVHKGIITKSCCMWEDCIEKANALSFKASFSRVKNNVLNSIWRFCIIHRTSTLPLVCVYSFPKSKFESYECSVAGTMWLFALNFTIKNPCFPNFPHVPGCEGNRENVTFFLYL